MTEEAWLPLPTPPSPRLKGQTAQTWPHHSGWLIFGVGNEQSCPCMGIGTLAQPSNAVQKHIHSVSKRWALGSGLTLGLMGFMLPLEA